MRQGWVVDDAEYKELRDKVPSCNAADGRVDETLERGTDTKTLGDLPQSKTLERRWKLPATDMYV